MPHGGSRSKIERGMTNKKEGTSVNKSSYPRQPAPKLKGFDNPDSTPKSIDSVSHGRPRNG